MEEKNKKDIVEHIIEKMKSMEELPYREGAWENFQKSNVDVPRSRNQVIYWVASVAAVLVMGFFLLRNWSTEESITSHDNELVNQGINPDQGQSLDSSGDASPVDPMVTENQIAIQDFGSAAQIESQGQLGSNESSVFEGFSTYANMNASKAQGMQGGKAMGMPRSLQTFSLGQYSSNLKADDEGTILEGNSINQELAYQATQAKNGKEAVIKDRKYFFKEKFDLGLFVSPNSTNEKFNFGGGVLVSYHVNKFLTVRTGLAYNRYDVSIMKDPVSNAETPVMASSDVIQRISTNGLMQHALSNNALILPNVNAISGNVQALEIPIDIKVKAKQGFYASTGLTYSAIFNQNRYTHYVENANSSLFNNGLPENESDMKTEVKQISRAIKTEGENVNSDGFGGFVNFSIGKEMRVNRNLKLSVEPYIKLPVGSFKQADMNYTNGGIRIITNF